MASPITSAATAPAVYTPPPYDPEIGDYSSYKPLAKTAWAQDGSDEHGLTFADFLDVINPLQHLPVISTIYRAITGDKIGLAAKLAGDALYGGPVGLLASGVTAAVEGIAGKSSGELLAELAHEVFGSDGDTPPAPQEARVLHPEATHEAALAAVPQAAMFPPATVVPPAPALAEAKVPAPTPVSALAPVSASASARAQALPPLPAPAPAAPLPAAVKRQPVALKSGGDETTRRIERSIAEARRAQASLLLTSLQEATPSPRAARREDASRDTEAKPAAAMKPPVAAPANPYLPSDQPSAIANWSNETLAETIARYERAVTANRR